MYGLSSGYWGLFAKGVGPRHHVIAGRLQLIVLFWALIGITGHAHAADVNLAWDAVQDNRVAYYELHYGTTSGQYQSSKQSTSTTTTVSSLADGGTYYFAVRACADGGSLCSDFSNEVKTTLAASEPVADFSISGPSGVVPHTVSFTNNSKGKIDSYRWTFGDGGTSTAASPQHVYQQAGVFTVSLSVTGPGGTSTKTRPDAITVTSAAPVADFTASYRTGTAPLTVTFRNASTGEVNACSWTFGDGNAADGCTAVHTYTAPGSYSVTLKVQGPRDADTETKTDFIKVISEAPQAQFSSDVTSGPVPLTVAFSDASSGNITGYQWNFGDGSTSTAANPSHTYDEIGDYDVTLTVSGPSGSDTLTKPGYIHAGDGDLPMEAGEITLTHKSQRVDFDHPFIDPVVVVKPLGANGGQPAIVRVESVDNDGFRVRIQEWNYLDGKHVTETVGYLVVERGAHELPNGRWIEADTIDLSGANGYAQESFTAAFTTDPVVFSSVITMNDATPVTTRMRGIDADRFQIALQEEEASSSVHGAETVAYVAWEPSSGEVNGRKFEVARTQDEVTHKTHHLEFNNAFGAAPVLIADMQTANGPDTANLRWKDKDRSSVDLWVDEEQSRDSETTHTTEAVGYIAIGAAEAAPPIAGLVAAYGFDEAAGSETSDASGNGHDGTVSGAQRTDGKFGRALYFDGVDDWVSVGDAADLDLTDGVTVEAWVNPAEPLSGWHCVLLKESDSGLSYGLYASSNTDQPVNSARIGSDRNLYGGNRLPEGEWTHLAATYDGATQRLYVNGSEVASRSLSGDIETSDGVLRIGGNNSWPEEAFGGVIDEVRIYDRALSGAEIRDDMATSVGSR